MNKPTLEIVSPAENTHKNNETGRWETANEIPFYHSPPQRFWRLMTKAIKALAKANGGGNG